MLPSARHGVFGSLIVVAICAAGCDSGEDAKGALAKLPPPPVTVSQPVIREVTDFDSYDGRISAVNTVDLKAQVTGYLSRISFNDGDLVKAGQVLIEIDDRPFKAALAAAKAQIAAAEASVKLAKAEYARYSALAAKGVATKEEAETWTAKAATAEADVERARASVEQAQLSLAFTRIVAPFEGRIGRRAVDIGNLVTLNVQLATIVSVQPMYVYFDVDERAVLRFREARRATRKPGEPIPPFKDLKMPVEVALEGENGYPHKGILDFADNQVNKATGTLNVRGVLDNKAAGLSDGLRARVRVPSGEPHKATLVSERAIGSEQGRKFVWVVDEKNIVNRRDVTTERTYDQLQAIQGVKEGELIVVSGIQRVREGATVAPNRVPMPDSENAPATSK
jgi:multidrug efflux system membrane fusion protein